MGSDIEILINKISRLPGLGPRSARRIVLHLIKDTSKNLVPIISAINNVQANVKECSICGNIDTFVDFCEICSDKSRNKSVICIVEQVSDLWAFERTKCFFGNYHVLNGILSATHGSDPEELLLDKLIIRCKENNVNELIIALSATVEGQTTDQYIRSYIDQSGINLKITSLAHGIPVGGELDYLDDGTLLTAYNARK